MTCPKCNRNLQLENFYTTTKRRSPYCKECSRAYAREHKYYKTSRERHKDEINSKNRELNKTPERKKHRRQIDQDRKFPYHRLMDESKIKRICSICESVNKLSVHHIDGNHHNNSLSNLQWLCVSCYNKIHNVTKIPKLARDDKGKFIRKE